MALFNIFSTKKNLSKNKLKPKIIIDNREKNSLVLSNLSEECQIELKNLEIGDYLIGQTIIERKTFSDFISSMLSKRLLEQLKQMQKYKSRLLILEGKNFEYLEENSTKLNPNSIRGMLISIPLEFNTGIIFTKDSEETSKYLILLAKKQSKKQNQDFTLHPRKPSSLVEQKQYVIESFPGIGPRTAKKLIKHFKSIKEIINSSQEELEKLIGKKSNSITRLLD